ncbi:MAG: THUMP domain-containing protein [Pseudomonadota bacterium]
MQEWNVVVTVSEQGFRRAEELLSSLGVVKRTDFFNVFLIFVEDIQSMLETLTEWSVQRPQDFALISRVVPATRTFTFQSSEVFKERAREIVLGWLGGLAGRSFHVRMHRRGFKEKLSSQEEERFMDDVLADALEKAGTPGRISFTDPDVIIAVETVGPWAGLSLWTRDDIERYPFLKLD